MEKSSAAKNESQNADDTFYYVEKILDRKVENGELRYLIKWQGYSSKDNSWEPEGNLKARAMVEEFNKKFVEKANKMKRLPKAKSSKSGEPGQIR